MMPAAERPDRRVSVIAVVENKLSDLVRTLQEIDEWQTREEQQVQVDAYVLFDDDECDHEMLEFAKAQYPFAKFRDSLTEGGGPPAKSMAGLAGELADGLRRGYLVLLDYRLSDAGPQEDGAVTNGGDVAAAILAIRSREAGKPLDRLVILSRYIALQRDVMKSLTSAGVQVVYKGAWDSIRRIFDLWISSQSLIASPTVGEITPEVSVTREREKFRRLKLTFAKIGVEAEGPQRWLTVVLLVFMAMVLLAERPLLSKVSEWLSP